MGWVDLAVAATTFLLVFPAELPDKSFVATLVLATRFGRLWVWVGAASAFAVQMLIAVVAGQLLGLLPRAVVLGATAALFTVGAVILIRGGLEAREQAAAELEAEEAEIAAGIGEGGGALRAVGASFLVIFTAEWGDLTQLVAAGQAARTEDPVSVFLGAWLALATVAAIGVAAGGWLAERVPLWRIRLLAGGVLIVLALVTVVELVRG
jgi:putative Ca2+/H+ antiporter (TMEM165/GDT1 family)